jgi:6,7-dimethyl-8-ribityllumazine synthase
MMADKYLSPTGVTKNLTHRLEQNENFRLSIFKGRFNEQIEDDKIKAAEDRLKANLEAGLM